MSCGKLTRTLFSVFLLLLTPSSFANDRVWVTRTDGSLQCDEKLTGTNDPLLKAKKELRSHGIRVLEAKKRNDGAMRAQACGFSTGNQTSFLIPRKDVAAAAKLGFGTISP